MAEQVGNCPCPDCGDTAKAMSDKRKFLYLNCATCGIFKYQTHTGQTRLKARLAQFGEMLGEAPPAVALTPEPAPQTAPEPAPEPKPEPARKKSRFFNLFRT